MRRWSWWCGHFPATGAERGRGAGAAAGGGAVGEQLEVVAGELHGSLSSVTAPRETGGEVGGGRQGGRREAERRRRRRVEVTWEAAGCIEEVGGEAIDRWGQAGVYEIGRASCRERVS